MTTKAIPLPATVVALGSTEMRIVLISDTHGEHGAITVPPCDLLIHAGDALNVGTLGELSTFSAWFNAQTQATTRIYVPGNHDRVVERNPSLARSMFSGASKILIDDRIRVGDLNIYGTPWTPEFCNWAFQGDDGKSPHFLSLRHVYGKIQDDDDVVICHGPPYGILDKNHEGHHCGSRVMRSLLESGAVCPKIYVCGHIHESAGSERFKNTIIYNAAIFGGLHVIDV